MQSRSSRASLMAEVQDHTIVASRLSQVRTALERIEVFADFPGPLLDELASEFRYAELEPGTVVVTQGTTGDRFFVVASGELEVLVVSDGVESRVGTLAGGDVFGETALLENSPRTATVRTITATTLWTLTKEAFQAWLSRVPELRSRVDEVVRRREIATAFMTLQ